MLVLYATEHLDMGAVGYEALTTASAAGGLLATACFGWLERHVSFATLMRVVLTLEVLMHLAFALTTTGWVALVIMFVFGAYAFVWGTISTTMRQRLVPAELQGRVASVNLVGVFGGMVIGQGPRRRDRAGVGPDGAVVVRVRGRSADADAGLAPDLADREREDGRRGRGG